MPAPHGIVTAPANAQPFDAEDVEYLRHGNKPLLARIYTPKGDGPFPAVVEVHSGGWCISDRLTEKDRHIALAKGGILVIALDFRQAREGAYPLAVADINYAIRWVKANARMLKTRSDLVGISGQSSGAHLAMLVAMRPHDPRYAAIALPPGSPPVDASVRCVVLSWPPINPLSRFRSARREVASGVKRVWPNGAPQDWPSNTIERAILFWQNEENMADGSPTIALERGEEVVMPPAIWFQINEDPLHNYKDEESAFPGKEPERFVASYRKAGGRIDIEYYDEPFKFTQVYPGSPASLEVFGKMVAFIHRHIPVT